MIRITSKQHLFRRAGMAHPKGPVEYPDAKFTAAQLKALKIEPMLKVEILPEKKNKEQDSGNGPKKSEKKEE